ncbi:MAG: UDP-N-acetylglucosamine 2-epimerase (non-hydrolyzing) [Oscillospiraceae bacterium]|jgi:UDP-N-acetylglucosamine 2-epimerase|nr:UDP-N-acetylglucosamine 2-epimerase (non-hydrolyzing) [Oscillospiraceae bacterium]
MNAKTVVMSVFGARPDAVKMAPLVKKLAADPEIHSVCCVTGQHRQMLDGILTHFGIKPDYDLDIMTPRQSLAAITAKTLTGMDEVFAELQPDLVLAHGDTSTGFAATLAAFYHKIPVGHVEAGLRTGARYSPFPEEMNRQMLARLATLHFCPTGNNKRNLEAEQVSGALYVTGNTVIDALKMTVREEYTFDDPALRGLDFANSRVLTVTAHRRENYGQALENICRALLDLRDRNPGVVIVYPVHLSPAVRDTVMPLLSGQERVVLTGPVGLLDMHNLIARSFLVLTDSGGLQEEAPALGKPVLVMRRETERPEAVAAGTVVLAGVERDGIAGMAQGLLDDPASYERMARAVNPYGDGHASGRIVHAVRYFAGLASDPPPAFGL